MSENQQLLKDIKQIYVDYDNSNKKKKKIRSTQLIIFLIIAYIFLLFIGTLCYHVLFDLDWIDSLYAATTIATGIDIEFPNVTAAQKVFVIIYALISIILFLSIANTIIDRLL
jgi:Kef-type K+ transport system membrane component KefB